jgi:DNA-directed RNA polymerase specialized sigma24 family protein
MKDPRLAAALLESSPDALAELFDAYGDRLFRYCWGMLRSRELAQVVLRDTLLVAQAHIARLADPEDPASLAPWLYSLARAECRRHQAVPPADADESPARLGLAAADARLMSWNAAMSLTDAEFEALDLACRHYVDLAPVLGRPAGEADDLLDRARRNLERALGAAILTGRGPACPGRDTALAAAAGLAGTGPAGPPGSLTAEVRERVLDHADACATCGPEVPRNVSATRVLALLPAPALTAQDRAEVLAALAGRQPPAAVPAQGRPVLGPPLASYVRASEPPVRFPAPPVHPPAAPVARSDASGPPPSADAAPRSRRVHRGRLLIAGAGVLVSAVVIASAIAAARPGQHAAGGVTPALAAGAASGPALQSSGLGAAGPVPSRAPSGSRRAGTPPATPPPLLDTAGSKNQVMITAATQPLPPGAAPGTRPNGAGSGGNGLPATPGALQLSARGLVLGGGSTGQVTLTAAGGPVDWSATVSGPGQVSLSSYGGTLKAGQRVTLLVQVSRGPDAGSATISFQGNGSDTEVVPVTWSARPGGSGSSWHPRPSPPGPSPSSGSMSGTPAPSPASLGPARSRSGRP